MQSRQYNYPSNAESKDGNDMVTLYKWAIGALTTIVIFLGTTYINTVQQSIKDQSGQLLQHEQRITTLEEGKRNTEAILLILQRDIEKIRDAVVK